VVRVVLFYLSVSGSFVRKLGDKITPNPCSAIAAVLRRVGVVKLLNKIGNMPHRGRTLSDEDSLTVQPERLYRSCFTRLTLNAMLPPGGLHVRGSPVELYPSSLTPNQPLNLGEFMQKIKGSVGNSEMKAQW
jgi:hypothetical protein